MNEIIPSTKLRMVSVHKLGDMTCLRKYFWRRILNLEFKGLNLNFWYGGVLGAGFEAMLRGKKWRKEMKAEDKVRREGYDLSDEDKQELDLQYKLIEAILEGIEQFDDVQKMHMTANQVQFSVPLKCGVKFCGTEDGEGTADDEPRLFEIKTATKVNESYFSSLRFDKQVNGYAWSRTKRKEKFLNRCMYCVFKKPQKRVKKKQTLDEFVEEIRQDVLDRPEMYFVVKQLRLGHNVIRDTGNDIERLAEILQMLYQSLLGTSHVKNTKALLDPANWPKQESKCGDYKGCEFIPLCSKPKGWEVLLRLYRQRKLMYEKEKEELET